MTTIQWDGNMPSEVREMVEPYLLRWLGLLPTWCQYFEVVFDPAAEAGMAVDVSHSGRWALLRVTGRWMEYSDEERERATVHELVHVGLAPLTDCASEIIERLTEEGGPLREFANARMDDAMECSVEDMARSIVRTFLRPED